MSVSVCAHAPAKSTGSKTSATSLPVNAFCFRRSARERRSGRRAAAKARPILSREGIQMNTLRHIFVASLMLATAAIHAQAGTVITSPANGAQVSSPFRLTMSADTCSSLPVSVVGYSLDNSAQTSSWSDQKIDGPVAAPQGWHTLHVKVWNYRGGVC